MIDRFRPNVAAMILDHEGRVLVAERIDFAGAWQFPQGGVDEGETLEEALHREMIEELSLEPEAYRVLQVRGGYRYRFPSRAIRFGPYVGQEQTYFLCRIRDPEHRFDLETEEPEFRSVQWIEPKAFQASWLPDFKREVYAQVLNDFFEVELS